MSQGVDPEFKTITHEGEHFDRVGCRNCAGGNWAIFTNGKGRFIAYCFCGNKIDISKATLQNKPDIKPIDMRMFV